MRVLLVSNYSLDKQYSMLKYGDWLQNKLTESNVIVDKISPPVVFGRLFSGSKLHKWLAYIDKFVLGGLQCAITSPSYDLVHILDHSNSFLSIFCLSRRLVITCHDVLGINAARGMYNEIRIGYTGKLLQKLILLCLKLPSYIVCVSQNTRTEIEKLLPYARCIVIENSLNRSVVPKRTFGSGNPCDQRYLFHIGGPAWYKNRSGVVKIFAELRRHETFSRHRLILAGRPLSNEERVLISLLGLEDTCDVIVGPSDSEVDALYRGADCLIFPSLHEGFGWPLLEARAHNCPIVTSSIQPMSDIAGPFALLVDPYSPPFDIAQYIVGNWAELQKNSTDNCIGLERFDAGHVQELYLKFYTKVFGNRVEPFSMGR